MQTMVQPRVLKELLVATEPYTQSFVCAERQLLLSFAFVAPRDRLAAVLAVPGGLDYAGPLRFATSMTDLTPVEYAERVRVACLAEPSAQGADVTPLALEVQRQLLFGFSMSPALMSTIRYAEDGGSGWPAAVIGDSPYSTCGHDDHALAGPTACAL